MFSHLRRRIGVLTAVAVLAALVPTLTTVSPASAAPATTAITAATLDAAPDYLACPTSASIPSAGFTDTTDTAVDCIKYYGITSGTTATTYSPTDSVSRWQMALYITRLLDVANVTLGTGADQGFTDISGKSAEIQTAINQIKQLGITTGVTATTYVPDGNVSRQEMALFIERMLDNLPAGPGGASEADGLLSSDAAIAYVNSNCGEGAVVKTCTGQYNYTDIDSGSVTVEASVAIKELFTLGIHDGVSATTFNPTSDMTRAAMATFMNAALNHTNVRPEGLHLQAKAYSGQGTQNPDMSVSYRDASFDPIASAPVDVHFWTNSTTEGNTNFLATGLCSTTYTAPTSDSITECYIDTNETATDENGNMTPTANSTTTLGGAGSIYTGTDTYHAWTAAAGTTYDNDVHGEAALPLLYSSVDVVANPAAAGVRCTMDTPANAKTTTAAHTVKFGVTTTVTCQVNDAALSTSAAVALPLQYVKYKNIRTFTTDSSGVQSGVIKTEEIIGATDASGTVVFTITGPTDTAGTDVVTDVVTLDDLTIGAINNAGTTVSTSGFMTATDADTLTFSLAYTDSTAAIDSISMTQTASSGVPSTSGVTRSVTANAWDQYGDISPAQTIAFTDLRTFPDNLGFVCTAATPTVCTTLAAHGLAVGDDLSVVTTGVTATTACTRGVVATTLAAADRVVVATVPTTTSFTVDYAGTTDDIGCGTATDAAGPLRFALTSFDNGANNTRVTSSTGAATFSWVDTEGTGGLDVVTAGSGGKFKSVSYYALTTAAGFSEIGDGTGTLDDDEIVGRIVEFDATGDDMIIEVTCSGGAGCTAYADTQTRVQYMQYTWDSNDQFANTGTNANPNGAAVTQSAWETSGALLAAANAGAGTYDDVFMIDWAPLSTGVSRFYTN